MTTFLIVMAALTIAAAIAERIARARYYRLRNEKYGPLIGDLQQLNALTIIGEAILVENGRHKILSLKTGHYFAPVYKPEDDDARFYFANPFTEESVRIPKGTELDRQIEARLSEPAEVRL